MANPRLSSVRLRLGSPCNQAISNRYGRYRKDTTLKSNNAGSKPSDENKKLAALTQHWNQCETSRQRAESAAAQARTGSRNRRSLRRPPRRHRYRIESILAAVDFKLGYARSDARSVWEQDATMWVLLADIEALTGDDPPPSAS